ncbi:hypothetical protein OZX72_03285 [Bifidobacterium sp. ESL0769]|uniref:hypothetical protein n=1 Tax=Bifidobacterium sp. ESL0769 TaxID=2983229 RepID=UPI0023FA18F4|nr:hypothetical protein [Bifidobacterium sp. ESL0769]WEV68016.1 hypothetical protein OZX72_03285 [Bifidobacterium sp. ESL0769]
MPVFSHRFNPRNWSLNQIREVQFSCMLIATLVSLPGAFLPVTWLWLHLLSLVAFTISAGIDTALNKFISHGPNGIFSMGSNGNLDNASETGLRDESALTHENQANTTAIFILFCVLICVALINQYCLDNQLRFTVYLLLFIASLMPTLQLGCYLYFEHRDMTRSETDVNDEA